MTELDDKIKVGLEDFKSGNFLKAKENFEELLISDPENYILNKYLATICLKLEEYKDLSWKYSSKALNKMPGDKENWFLLIEGLIVSNQIERARNIYLIAIEKGMDKNLMSNLDKIISQYEMRRNTKLTEKKDFDDYEPTKNSESNELNNYTQETDYLDLYNIVASIEIKDYENVIFEAQNIINLYPENPIGWEYSAIGKMLKENFNDAIKDFEKSISYGSDNNLTSINLASCYMKVGKVDKVKTIITGLRKKNPDVKIPSYLLEIM